MKVIVVIGACCYNKGSEALARGTVNIIKKAYPACEIILCSGEKEFGAQLNIENVDRYVRRQAYYGGYSLKRGASAFCQLIKREDLADRFRYSFVLNECKNADLIVVICGDNYDKSYHMYNYMHSLNKAIRHCCKGKMIMYDCSLEFAHIDEAVIHDFQLFDGLTVREHISLEAFREKIPTMNCYYAPDPAFVMPPIKTKRVEGLIPSKSIGINLSTMVVDKQYGSDSKKVLAAYRTMIDRFLEKTDRSIVLLPHVMRNLDLKVLRELYENYKDNSRVHLIENEDFSAPELKYLISQFEFFIGARTHSTIAAYSSCVPTFVIGYSVKSIGIARDLFGSDKGYVIPVGEISEGSILADLTEKLYNDREAVRKHLKEIMPAYIESAWKVADYFKNIVEGNNDY